MRIFQCLLRITEWYGMVRDKYCSNESIAKSEAGENIRMFHPHNCDPDHFIVPTTWRNPDVEAEMNRLRRISVKMPSGKDIAWAMGASPAKADQLYNEFVDYAAQRLAEHDKRDRQQSDRIAIEVEKLLARMRMNLSNKMITCTSQCMHLLASRVVRCSTRVRRQLESRRCSVMMHPTSSACKSCGGTT